VEPEAGKFQDMGQMQVEQGISGGNAQSDSGQINRR
jgi:hypothetical protein